MIVHRESEQHSHDEDRHEADHGAHAGDVQEVGEPPPLENGRDHAAAIADHLAGREVRKVKELIERI